MFTHRVDYTRDLASRKNLGAKTDALLEVYTKQIRCTLELAVPVWNFSLTIKESNLIEPCI